MITSASHGDSEVTPNAKSVIWAGIVIFALAATIWYLLPHGQPAPVVPQKAPALVTAPKPPMDRAAIREMIRARRPHVKRPFAHEGTELGRIRFVSQLQERYAKQNKSVSADAVGPDKRRLRLMWPPRQPDHDHIQQLKGAEPFAAELRGKGFTSIVMQVGERIIWQKDL